MTHHRVARTVVCLLLVLPLSQRARSAAPPNRTIITKAITDTAASPHARLRCADCTAASWTEGFWAERFRLCREATLPRLYDLAADPNYGHVLSNLRIAAGLEPGEFAGTHWQDAWIYKWLEAASAVYATTKDPRLDRRMDEVIDVIRQGQEADGYIASQITARNGRRFEDPHHHECYTMGHLLTAACVHHRITGKDNFLDVARKTADYLYSQFKDRNPNMAHFPRNPSVIMGAVELYRTTGRRRYLDLANTVINMRGAFKGGNDLNQDRISLRHEREVVGHAVFYTYLYAGAADAYMETGDQTLLAALERLWTDLVHHKMYITGGCCALHRGLSVRKGNVWGAHDVHEAAGPPYHLPNDTAYNETCAQVGNFMWNWRMLCITGQAKYADVMEREMFNGFLSGISLDGKRFFYSNPLRWHGAEHTLLSNDTLLRHEIGSRNRICCPTNVLRTLAELHTYLYTTDANGLWVHHYGGSTFDNETFRIRQDTDYPWDGTVKITIEKAPAGSTIRLRIPDWARKATVRINGKASSRKIRPGTYASLRRDWQAGDEIALVLPMDVRLMIAHPKVEADRGQVAVMRGPLVYCLESTDLPSGVALADVVLPRDIQLTPRRDRALLGGVTVLEGRAPVYRQGDWSQALYQELPDRDAQTIPVRLIPYYAWANRGVSEMSVWLPLQ